MSKEERHVQVTIGKLAEFGDALNWALNVYDREFASAEMLKLNIEQVMSMGMEVDAEWEKTWSASISGLISETEVATQTPTA